MSGFITLVLAGPSPAANKPSIIRANQAPTANDQTVNTTEDAPAPITLTGSDADGDPLAFNVASQPAKGVLSGTAPNLVYTPNPDANGTDSFTFTVTAGGETSAPGTVSIIVAPVQDPPVLESIGDRTGITGSVLSFAIAAADPDGDTLSYSASNLPAGAVFDSGTRTFSWTPAYDQGGVYTGITFTVDDGNGGTDSESISITITKTNRAPLISATPSPFVSVAEGATLTIAVDGSDPDGDSITFTAEGTATGLTPDTATFSGIGNSRSFVWTPGYDRAGSYTAVFTVDDGTATSSVTVNITVTNTNRAPAVQVSGGSSQGVAEGDTINITVTGSDPDSDTLSFSMTGSATGLSPDAAILSGTGNTRTFSWTPGYNRSSATPYVVTFTVADGAATASATVSVTVTNTNRPPIVSTSQGPSVSVYEATTLTIYVWGNDPDGDALTFSAGGTATGLTPDAATFTGSGTFTFTWTPGYERAGSYTAIFTAEDGSGGTATATVAITVLDNNRAPLITASPAGPTVSVAEGSPLVIELNGSDADGDPLTFSFRGDVANLTPDAPTFTGSGNSRTFTWTPGYSRVGPAAPLSPVNGYLARYLDSFLVPDYQSPVRTYRARLTRVAPEYDRIFMILGGGTFASYQLSTFRQRLQQPRSAGRWGEQYVPWDMRVDPQAAGSGWSTILMDGQDRLFGFDWDDRGYIYLAYSVWGWGIVNMQGTLQAQRTAGDLSAAGILTLHIGDTYYALVTNNSSTDVYDVTNPASPLYVRRLPFGTTGAIKVNGYVSILAGGQMRVFTPDALVTGGTYTTVLPGDGNSFNALTGDGTSFYATRSLLSGGFSIEKVDFASGTAAETTLYSRGSGYVSGIEYGGNHLVAYGGSPPGMSLVTIVLRRNGMSWTANDLTFYMTSTYTPKTPSGRLATRQIYPLQTADGPLLFANLEGIGDIFSLADITAAGSTQVSAAVAKRNGLAIGTESLAGSSYLAVFSVSDGKTTTETALTINVTNTDRAPVLDPVGDRSVDAASLLAFTVTATDPDGEAPSFTATGLPPGSTFSSGGHFSWIPNVDQSGTHAVTFTATDGSLSDSETLTITVIAPFGAPPWLSATASSASEVELKWPPVAGATAYEVFRKSADSGYSSLLTTGTTSARDTGLIPGKTHVYQVRAIGSSASPFSPPDAATTILFADPSLAGVVIKRDHLFELRNAINAMREAAGIGAASYTDPSDPITIKAVHFTEMRTALDEARSALGLSPMSYTDPTILPGMTVKGVHVLELRNGTQ